MKENPAETTGTARGATEDTVGDIGADVGTAVTGNGTVAGLGEWKNTGCGVESGAWGDGVGVSA